VRHGLNESINRKRRERPSDIHTRSILCTYTRDNVQRLRTIS